MDADRNASVFGWNPAECQPEKVTTPASSKLEEFFPGEHMDGDDVGQEWLSIFLEDCFSSINNFTVTTNSLPAPNHQHQNLPPQTTPKPPQPQSSKPPLQDIVVPAKARTKRRRITPSTHYSHDILHNFHVTPSDPPLLHQAHWLADSELIFPKKEQQEGDRRTKAAPAPEVVVGGGGGGEEGGDKMGKEGSLVQPRRCTHCLSQRTPQWRAGPLGPKTLCNACGVRFKSGRLLPEYRPAKSPTFVSYKHSNSHKKVMEMRMAILSSQSV